MLYAAYGSNLHPLRLAARIPSARLVTTSFLPNWTLHFHKLSKDGSGKCNIFSGSGGIHIAIFDISVDDKLALDKIEGLGSGYSEVLLQVPGVGDCMSYTAQETHVDDSLVPYDWYKELVLMGARAHSFPDNYLNQISSCPTRKDPDPDRRAKIWQTVDMVRSGGSGFVA